MFVDTLESRRLFTAAAPVLAGSELRVFGDTGADTIKVFNSDATTVRVEVNGAVFFFAQSAVRSVRANVSPLNLNTGTAGNDSVDIQLAQPATVFGGAGNDTLRGGSGNDLLLGEAGNDVLVGNAGNDNLQGGDGNNTLSGGDGNDTLTAGLGHDDFDGGAGIDTVSYADRTANVIVSLDNAANDGQVVAIKIGNITVGLFNENDNVRDSVENVTTGSGNDTIVATGTAAINNVFIGGLGNDKLDGGAGDDSLLGQDGNDTLIGRDGKDFIQGGAGNDVISGGQGDDTLSGGIGDDIITGGLGRDTISGDDGNDFIFAQDGQADNVINGGAGNDFVDKDAFDFVVNAETIV